jgi:hypothetical protein
MKTTADFKKAGKTVYNYITAYYPSRNDLSVAHVMKNDEIKAYKIDDSHPITVARCTDMHKRLCEMTGENIGTVRINIGAFEPGGEDGNDLKLWEKVYTYNPESNSLTIWEDGEFIYVNNNGIISMDKAALAGQE